MWLHPNYLTQGRNCEDTSHHMDSRRRTTTNSHARIFDTPWSKRTRSWMSFSVRDSEGVAANASRRTTNQELGRRRRTHISERQRQQKMLFFFSLYPVCQRVWGRESVCVGRRVSVCGDECQCVWGRVSVCVGTCVSVCGDVCQCVWGGESVCLGTCVKERSLCNETERARTHHSLCRESGTVGGQVRRLHETWTAHPSVLCTDLRVYIAHTIYIHIHIFLYVQDESTN